MEPLLIQFMNLFYDSLISTYSFDIFKPSLLVFLGFAIM